jgi:hypothetical protein
MPNTTVTAPVHVACWRDCDSRTATGRAAAIIESDAIDVRKRDGAMSRDGSQRRCSIARRAAAMMLPVLTANARARIRDRPSRNSDAAIIP